MDAALEACMRAVQNALDAYNATVARVGRLNWSGRMDAQQEYERAVASAWRTYDEATW